MGGLLEFCLKSCEVRDARVLVLWFNYRRLARQGRGSEDPAGDFEQEQSSERGMGFLQ